MQNGEVGEAISSEVAFEGNNWRAGLDINETLVFGQYLPGSVNGVLAVANAATLERLGEVSSTAFNVGDDQVFVGPAYYYTPDHYNWEDAQAFAEEWGAPGEVWQLVSINSREENDLVWDLLGGEDAWIGGSNVLSDTSGTEWSLQWEDGTTLAHDDGGWTGRFLGGQPNNHPENGGDQDHLMMRHADGRWNDRNGAEETHAVLERQPGWVTEENVSERQTDYAYRMTTQWDPISDVRTDLVYLAFSNVYDIEDFRPYYETVESLVPVIKMEQVTNWTYVPVIQTQALPVSASVGNADPFDLAVFDLDTLSATGDITIGGTRVDVQANVSSRGQTERVILTEAGGRGCPYGSLWGGPR